MRVLHLLNELRPSGAEVMLRCAAPHWAGEGVVAEILSVGDNLGPYAEDLAAAGYPLHHLPFSWSPGFVAALRQLAMKFDLVHVHTERANFLYGLTCGLLARRAVVRTIHSNFLYGGRVRLKLRVQRRLLRALGIRHIAISRGVQDNEQGRYGNASRLIYNWFDTSRFAALAALDRDSERQRWHLAHDQIAVLVLGNCSPIKNHLAVVEALARLRPPSGSNVVILHAGLEDAARTEWNRARQLGVDGRIRFLGKVDDVPSLMVASDLYLMPSLHEGFSIAGLEALGAGLPGILSDRPGLADLREFFSGLVYTGVTPEAVATGLETAVATLPALLEQASGNRDKARQCFSPKRGVSEYAEVYREAACRN